MRFSSAKARAFSLVAVLLLVCLTYSNHFRNEFHFDDFHTVTGNVFVRDLKNVPRFFTDPTTSSAFPPNQAWRPIVTASVAIDYWLASGYHSTYFHASQFIWFLTQLTLLYVFSSLVLRSCWEDMPWAPAALFTTAWYGLHPAVAETVNYIIQRAEVISTCGVLATLTVFAGRPGWRKYGVYLLPACAGALAKATALVFPLLIFSYLVFIEVRDQRSRWATALRQTAWLSRCGHAQEASRWPLLSSLGR